MNSGTMMIDTDDDGAAAETPTTWKMLSAGMPDGIISEWDYEGVANWIAGLGYPEYKETLLDNRMDGEAIIRCGHEDLKELGVTSVGHRLSILKNIYNVKVAHDIPIDSDDYVPVSVDSDDSKAASQQDIQRLITIIRQRDQRIRETEAHVQSLYDTLNKLRHDLMPVWAMVKNRNQDLPPLSGDPTRRGDADGGAADEQMQVQAQPQVQDPPPPAAPSLPVRGLSRKFSMKKLILGTPKNSSPTFQNSSSQHDQYDNPPPPLNNVSAVSAAPPPPQLNGTNSLPPPYESHPSPTSPAHISHPSHAIPSHRGTGQESSRSIRDRTPRTPHYPSDDGGTSSGTGGGGGGGGGSGGGGGGDSSQGVEIFKSFRVSMDDPCYKVLPAALKRYNIQADWRQYALYIVHGDQERCLGLEERPLILFKQLDKEGRKPMFMLRRNVSGGDIGAASGISVPGGVL